MAQLFSQVASRLQQVRLQGIGRRFSSVSLHKRLGIWKRGPTKTLQNSCGTACSPLPSQGKEKGQSRAPLRFFLCVCVCVCVSDTAVQCSCFSYHQFHEREAARVYTLVNPLQYIRMPANRCRLFLHDPTPRASLRAFSCTGAVQSKLVLHLTAEEAKAVHRVGVPLTQKPSTRLV